MLIDRLQNENVPLTARSQQSPPSSTAHDPPDDKARTEETQIADQVLFSKGEDARLGAFRLQNEWQNRTAAAIRETDRTAREMSQKVDSMVAPLKAIVKNFPPFSTEDKERMELLRSYTSIRKEIDQLTVPPPPTVLEARRRLELPAPLGMDADDRQIADHIDKLDAASREIDSFRGEIADATARFVQEGRFFGMFSAPQGGETGDFAPLEGESAAAQISAEVGQQFAESVSQGVAARHSQFLKGLR